MGSFLIFKKAKLPNYVGSIGCKKFFFGGGKQKITFIYILTFTNSYCILRGRGSQPLSMKPEKIIIIANDGHINCFPFNFKILLHFCVQIIHYFMCTLMFLETISKIGINLLA